MPQLPNGLVAFGPSANCTLDLCPLEASILQYQPSLAASGTLIGIFSLILIVQAIQGIWTCSWGFMFSMIFGCILEIAGYTGRIIIHGNPFDFNGFITQIVCITVAPIFFCSAIYVLLSQVINRIDSSISRFKPQLIYWIFIPVDVISLVLQAAGGALSSVSTTQDNVQVGVNISLAGLLFQVFTLFCFCALFVDYLTTCKKSLSWVNVDKPMKNFLSFLFLSFFFILMRCVYRIVELHDGYFSHWFRDETLFICLESAIMCLAVTCLTIGHPGPVLGRTKGTDCLGYELN
ncbi:parasitic phase-specific protein PSP-1 [Ilyonectria robusta]